MSGFDNYVNAEGANTNLLLEDLKILSELSLTNVF